MLQKECSHEEFRYIMKGLVGGKYCRDCGEPWDANSEDDEDESE